MNLGLAKPSGFALSREFDGPTAASCRQEDTRAQATTLSPQALANAAKALIQAYNDKNWEQAKAGITPDFVYDEVATAER